MRLGIIAIQHESNTFVPARTTIDDFRRDALLTGGEMADYCRHSRHETGGFWHELSGAGAEPVPLLLALAMPGGILTAQTAEQLVTMAVEQLQRAGCLDGLLVAPHGAAVSESSRDFDGDWLQRMRAEVDSRLPIIGTLDPHANVSPSIIAATNAMIAYRTNPHVDQYETGQLAARLMLRTVRGEIRPTQALVCPPVAISIDRQATSESPCRELYACAEEKRHLPGVLAISVVLGFPYADVEKLGSAFVAVTDNDPMLAQTIADELAGYLVVHRADFFCALPGIDEALQQACDARERLCLLDVGDNVGGGAAGDGVLLARRLHELGIGPALVCICDAEAAADAQRLAPGGNGAFRIGGRGAVEQGEPWNIRATVQWLGEGRFEEPGQVHGGRNAYDMGPTAVVTTDRGLTILLTTNRVPPFSLRQLTACNLRPTDFRVIVAKGVNAPIAAYRQVCDRFVRANTPGVTCADMTQLGFCHRRRPLFPFEAID